MQLFITILHVLLSLALILIILLQPGKEGAAVLGGGGGNQSYGPRGQANFLGRATTVVAALFMVTSITLAYRSSERTQAGTGDLEDVMKELDAEDDAPATIAPPTPAPAPVPVAPEVPAPVEADAAGDGAETTEATENTENTDAAAAPAEGAAADPAAPADGSNAVDSPEEGQ